VAIALLEYLGDNGQAVPIQIFATDVSESAIEVAREGLYPGSIDGDVSPERLRRFFVQVDGGYRVGNAVRDLCVFARQDLTRDPPFSKLDLILCRNVLIYMDANLQRSLMAVFHYALRSGGFLMLGHAETIGVNVDLFSVTDKKHRIYAKQAVATVPMVGFQAEYPPSARTPIGREAGRARTSTASVRDEANRVVLDRFAPPGVVVDSDFHVVQFRGQTGRYLEPAPGDPSLSLLKMAREGLVFGLRAALQAARKDNRAVVRAGLTVRSNGGWRSVDLNVIPLKVNELTHYLVVFREPADGEAKSPGKRAPKRESRRGDPRVVALEQELAANREHLQSIIQDLEAANEELQSANEEILSSNEELQSTNEELDTAKEELQSTNEELNTLNEELHGRNDELARVNSDLLNLLGSVEIAIVIVASDLRIRRFTPMAERVLNLRPADVGRPIGHIKPNIDCPDLEMLIIDTVDRVVVTEREVRDQHGNWFSLRLRPYKNIENKIDGAVLALFDIGLAKRHEEQLRQTRDFAEALHECLPHPMVLVDQRFRVHSVNRAFSETFGVSKEDAEGRGFFELPLDGWNLRVLRREIQPRIRDGGDIDPLVLEHEVPGAEGRRLRITGRRVATASAEGSFTVIALEDLSARSDADQAADDGADE
jgi:two-component system CheB/CheR fusion protein